MRNRPPGYASFKLLGLARNRTIAFVGWMRRGEREPRSREAAPRPPAPRRGRAQLPPARLGGPHRGPPCDAQPRSPEAQQAAARARTACICCLFVIWHFDISLLLFSSQVLLLEPLYNFDVLSFVEIN